MLQSSRKITAAAFLTRRVAIKNNFKVGWPFAILYEVCLSSFGFGIVISSMALRRSTTRARLQLVLPEERVMLERPALRFRGSASFRSLRKKLVEGMNFLSEGAIRGAHINVVREHKVFVDVCAGMVYQRSVTEATRPLNLSAKPTKRTPPQRLPGPLHNRPAPKPSHEAQISAKPLKAIMQGASCLDLGVLVWKLGSLGVLLGHRRLTPSNSRTSISRKRINLIIRSHLWPFSSGCTSDSELSENHSSCLSH